MGEKESAGGTWSGYVRSDLQKMEKTGKSSGRYNWNDTDWGANKGKEETGQSSGWYILHENDWSAPSNGSEEKRPPETIGR